jgi:hypothetical protein
MNVFPPPFGSTAQLGVGRLHETFRFTSVTRSSRVGRTPWMGDQLVARLLPVHKHRKTHTTQTLNIHALSGIQGRAIAQAVNRWLPTAAARVQSRVLSSGICGGQSGVGAGFLRILRFPLSFIPPNSPSSQSPGAGTIGQ